MTIPRKAMKRLIEKEKELEFQSRCARAKICYRCGNDLTAVTKTAGGFRCSIIICPKCDGEK